MRSRIIEEYKKTLFLSERQQQILIGLILGDAHLEQLYTPSLARLKVEHSMKQKEYVDWLYNEFKHWVRTKPRVRNVNGFGKMHINYCFSTYGHMLLGNFQKEFYVEKKKIAPDSVERNITPLVLAVWYMDDGSIKSHKHRGIFLNTQGFNDKSVVNLRRMLKNKFDFDSSVKRDKDGYQIYLGGKNGAKFIELIKPHIIPSMRYKIPKNLRLTELPKR